MLRTDPFIVRTAAANGFVVVDSRTTPHEAIIATAPKRDVAVFIANALAERLRQQHREVVQGVRRSFITR